MDNLYPCEINNIGQTELYNQVLIGCHLPYVPRIGDLIYLKRESCEYFDVTYKKEYWEPTPDLMEKYLKNDMKAPSFSGYVTEIHYYHDKDSDEPAFSIYIQPEE